VHKTAASNLLALAHENYQCPVLDDDQAFVSPCDNMNYEEIDKVIEMGKKPSIKAIVVMPANVTPKKTDDLTVEKQVTSAMLLNHAECKNSQVDVVVGPTKSYDPLSEEGHNVPLPLPQLLVGDMLPNKIAPLHKRKYAVHTPSMDNEKVTRAKGKVASPAKSIRHESG
jgi:hypothetical protein